MNFKKKSRDLAEKLTQNGVNLKVKRKRSIRSDVFCVCEKSENEGEEL